MVSDRNSYECPMCNYGICLEMLECKDVPVLQNVILNNEKEAVDFPKDIIKLCLCKKCGVVFNGLFKDYNLYGVKYDNAQSNSSSFRDYMQRISEFIESNMNLKGKQILEIGCGQGDFLKLLSRGVDCKCYGFDPSFKDDETSFKNLTFSRTFFDDKSLEEFDRKFDLIILRHIVEHLQNPGTILDVLCNSLDENGIVYIEVPDLDYILNNHSFFDLIYEHCNYFNRDSAKTLLARANLEIVDLQYNFSNQYLCILARKTKSEQRMVLASNEKYFKLEESIISFEKNRKLIIEKIKKIIENKKEIGNLCFWGAGAKGMMCCNIFDSERKYIDCVVDIRINKQNTYIAGTGHVVIAPTEILSRKIKYIIILNKNYSDEINKMVKKIDAEIEIFNIDDIVEV